MDTNMTLIVVGYVFSWGIIIVGTSKLRVAIEDVRRLRRLIISMEMVALMFGDAATTEAQRTAALKTVINIAQMR